MKKLVVVLFALVFTLGIVGCKGEKEEDKVPACDKICEHAFGIMLTSVPAEEKKELEGEKDEFMKDCAEDCGKQFDDEAKKCFMGTKTEDDMKKCEKEARKRRKAAKKEKTEDKPEEKKEEAK
jgi:hypothetical protein